MDRTSITPTEPKKSQQATGGDRTKPSHERRSIAFLCHPFHRGGVTRWMVDAAVESARAGQQTWFVVPKPQGRSPSTSTRPSLVALLATPTSSAAPHLITTDVGNAFELGTQAYRASVYAYLVRTGLPAGTPVVVSDDAAVWAGAAALGTRNPVIGVLHADEEKYYALAKKHESQIAAFVGVSRRIARTLGERIPTLGGRVATIPCGVPEFDLDSARTSSAENVFRIAWVGRIHETQKRTSDLPKIVSHVREMGCALHLDIVGDGPDRQSLANGLASAGLGESATFHGWLPTRQVLQVLSSSDVLLLPSNFEGMPVSVMEALMAGCAVVASRTSGIEDIEHHPMAANCFWTYPVGDVQQAAHCLLDSYRTPQSVRRLQAKRFAVSEFSIKRCVDRYCSLVSGVKPFVGDLHYNARVNLVAQASLSLPLASFRAARRAVWAAAKGHAVA